MTSKRAAKLTKVKKSKPQSYTEANPVAKNNYFLFIQEFSIRVKNI